MTPPVPPAGNPASQGNNGQQGNQAGGQQPPAGYNPYAQQQGQNPYAQNPQQGTPGGQQPPAGYNPYAQQQGQNPYAQNPQAGGQQPPAGYNPYAQQQGQNPYAQNPQAGGQQPPAGYNPYAQQPGQNPYAQNPQAGGQQPPAGYNPNMPYPPQGQPGMYPPPGQPPMPPQEVVTQPIGEFGMTDGFKTKIKLPVHKLQFDENLFLKLLAGSISLTKDEKKRIIGAVPQLTQFQVDELIRILSEEKQKFSELDMKHKEQLDGLQGTHHQEWEELEAELTSGDAKAKEQAELEQARAAAAALQQGQQPPKK